MPEAHRLSIGAAIAAGSMVFTPLPAAATAPETPRHLNAVTTTGTHARVKGPAASKSLKAVVPASSPSMTYQVQSGDTVWSISNRTGVSISAIISANDLRSDGLIRVGQVLKIPSPAASASSTPSTSTPSTTTTSGTITIKSGDTLSALAKKHGTTVAAIMSANGMKTTTIYAGRTLIIPGTSSTQTSGSSSDVPQRVGNTFLHYTYPQHVVDAANVNLDALLKAGVPSRAQMQQLVRETAISMGVDPALALAVAMKESSFNHASVSPANAIGTMQVIPTSGQWASDLVGYELNLLNPQDNVTAGVAILRQLVRTAPSLDIAIASYYQGYGSVTRNGMFSDTKQYVAGVRSLMTQFGG